MKEMMAKAKAEKEASKQKKEEVKPEDHVYELTEDEKKETDLHL